MLVFLCTHASIRQNLNSNTSAKSLSASLGAESSLATCRRGLSLSLSNLAAQTGTTQYALGTATVEDEVLKGAQDENSVISLVTGMTFLSFL